MSHISSVSIISEYGNASPYVAMIKAPIISVNPELNLIEISNQVKKDNLIGTAYLLRSVISSFRKNSIHLVSVSMNLNYFPSVLIMETHYGYVVSADNGLASLLPFEDDVVIWKLKNDLVPYNSLFPDKTIFPFIVNELVENGTPERIAEISQPETSLGTFSPSVETRSIKGQIVFFDGYENAITNIHQSVFEQMMSQFKSFDIFVRRKTGINFISNDYHDQRQGDLIAVFNSSGYLEIAIKQGKAGSLLGLILGSPVIIEFND